MKWGVPVWVWGRRIGVGFRRAASFRPASVSATSIVAVLALVLSGATFYRQFVYSSRALGFIILQPTVEESGVMAFPVTAINSGTRDVAVVDAWLAIWDASAGDWAFVRTNGLVKFRPVVVRADAMVIFEVRAFHDPEIWSHVGLPAGEGTRRRACLGIHFTIIDDNNRTYRSLRVVGKEDIGTQLTDNRPSRTSQSSFFTRTTPALTVELEGVEKCNELSQGELVR